MTKTEAMKQAQLKESTILIEGIDAEVIKCTARKAFFIGEMPVVVGQTFYLVRSSVANRYYVVASLKSGGYECSCPSCQKRHGAQCKHIVIISEMFRMKFSLPKIEKCKAASPQTKEAKPVAKEQSEEEKRREGLLALGNRGGRLSGRAAA